MFIKLPVKGVNHQRFLVCTNHDKLLHTYTFSCATDVDKMKDLLLTISGYDVSIDSIWTTMLKLNITCNIDTVDKNHKTLRELYIVGGVASVVGAIIGTMIITTVVIVLLIKWYNKRWKHTMSRRLYVAMSGDILKKMPYSLFSCSIKYSLVLASS